jgi:hypothetical protein
MEARDLKSLVRELSAGFKIASLPKDTGPTESERLALRDELLSKQKSEMERLTELHSRLASEVDRLEQIFDENEKLRAELTQPQIAGLSSEEAEELAKARDKALSVQCINNLKQFGLSVRTWALDNDDRFPPDIVCMSNELSTTRILICPADNSHLVATDWSTFTPANCSYEYLATNGSDEELTRVLSRCRIHGHIGLCDGSVQRQVAKIHPEYLIVRNGKLYLEAPVVQETPQVTDFDPNPPQP